MKSYLCDERNQGEYKDMQRLEKNNFLSLSHVYNEHMKQIFLPYKERFQYMVHASVHKYESLYLLKERHSITCVYTCLL
jgi:hypothetical protein